MRIINYNNLYDKESYYLTLNLNTKYLILYLNLISIESTKYADISIFASLTAAINFGKFMEKAV